MQISSNPPLQAPRVKVQLEVSGDGQGGFYEQLQGDGVDLTLTNHPTYTNIGGLLIENEGSYQAGGRFNGLETDLKIVPEDEIANVGGLHIQTGTIYHVDGKVGAQTVRADIREEEKIENVGGLNIQSDTWKILDGPGVNFEVRHEGEGHRITGQDQGRPVDLSVFGLNGGDEFILQGQAPAETLAEIATLRPFLAV